MKINRNKDNCHGLLGKVYYTFKKVLWENQEDFYMLIGMEERTAASYIKSKYHVKTIEFDYFDYQKNQNLISEIKIKNNIEKAISLHGICLSNYNKSLIEIIKKDNCYLKQSFHHISDIKILESKCLKYEREDIEKLISYFRIYNSDNNFVQNLFLVLHLALTKKLPKEIFYGSIFETHLHEFNEKVTKLYGMTSVPATKAILQLADGDNLIALYEKAEMFYYGRNNIAKNIPRAYECYKKVAGLSEYSILPDERKMNHIHPLALWSLSYILFNYHRKNNELENCECIDEIDKWSTKNGKLFVIDLAIRYADCSLKLIDNAPSANLLGKIALLREEEMPGIEALKKKYELKTAEEYFKYAADKGYVYAINNEAISHSQKIFTDTADRKKEHLEKYLSCLKKSANQYESWACTELGNFYRTGKVVKRSDNTLFRTDISETFLEYVSMKKALNFYKKASDIELDRNSGWACFNILLYFSEYVKSENKLAKYTEKIENLGVSNIINKTKYMLPRIYGMKYEDILKLGGDKSAE